MPSPAPSHHLTRINAGLLRAPLDHASFERFSGAHLALWWIPAGTVPTPEEGERRLETLRAKGPSAEAFTLRDRFDPPATPQFPHS
ncbi:DUF3291 domain-containing protein [Nocardiopsis exhalans]|uniref:DUF3291 domain-containing protein n=1 Tax=Nocardiopsis exhalans TaxID=163604 RepID=A0ABY5D9R2_9ACTN|nr:DUF3291 domain-containing protein [Nocardiopsis exhalans]USY19887.1 DUF3291 domain-containing protein [Nocardiopsis exhalans]